MFGGNENTGVTFEMHDYLATQVELLKLVSGKYVRESSGELYEANVKHLFPGDIEQARLINPGSYIASVVYDWVSSYVGEPKENQNIDYIDLFEGFLATGYFRFFQNPDTEKLESIKSKNYYYDSLEKKEYFINLYEKKLSEGRVQNYLLIEVFQKSIFERKLFKINNLNNLSVGTEVPLNTLPILEGVAEKLTITGLDRLVIEKKVEQPMLEKLKTIIYSIDKKLSEAEKNFLNYTEQFKIFRGIKIPEHAYKTLDNGIKIVDFDKLGKLIITNDVSGVEGTIEIVKNTNELLVQSLNFIDTQIRFICSITGIPTFAFGLQINEGNDSGTSKTKSMGIFYKKVERYQKVILKLFYEYWENFQILEKDQILEFPDITTADPVEVVDTQIKMINAGLQSKKRAIMKVQNTDETDANNIIKEIEEENKNNINIKTESGI